MKPMSSPRPRRASHGGVYMPKSYQDWKLLFGFKIKKLVTMHDGPVIIDLEFNFKKPKSWSKKKKAEADWHTSKPDMDNLEKSVLDALNGIAYKDDSQVCKVTKEKKWAEEDAIFISVKRL